MEIQNANPTIINTADLPSRRRPKRTKAKGKKASAARRLGAGGDADAAAAFFDYDSSWDPSSFETDGDSGYYEDGEDVGDPIDEQEVFDLLSSISDPEHPLTLGQLAVVNLADIHINPPPDPNRGPDLDTLTTVTVDLTPTVNHCSLATIIGLAVRVRLDACLPPNYRLDVRMKDGSHAQDDQVNKQLADKERVAAALENDTLRRTLETMMKTCERVYESDDGEMD